MRECVTFRGVALWGLVKPMQVKTHQDDDDDDGLQLFFEKNLSASKVLYKIIHCQLNYFCLMSTWLLNGYCIGNFQQAEIQN